MHGPHGHKNLSAWDQGKGSTKGKKKESMGVHLGLEIPTIYWLVGWLESALWTGPRYQIATVGLGLEYVVLSLGILIMLYSTISPSFLCRHVCGTTRPIEFCETPRCRAQAFTSISCLGLESLKCAVPSNVGGQYVFSHRFIHTYRMPGTNAVRDICASQRSGKAMSSSVVHSDYCFAVYAHQALIYSCA